PDPSEQMRTRGARKVKSSSHPRPGSGAFALCRAIRGFPRTRRGWSAAGAEDGADDDAALGDRRAGEDDRVLDPAARAHLGAVADHRRAVDPHVVADLAAGAEQHRAFERRLVRVRRPAAEAVDYLAHLLDLDRAA